MSYITWRVEGFEVRDIGEQLPPSMRVDLRGIVSDPVKYKSRNHQKIIRELEEKLNLEDITRRDDATPARSVSYVSYSEWSRQRNSKSGANTSYIPSIKNVIHNSPATIVFWADGTKTVVKCQPGDVYDPEKGLAMAICKKALGNQGNYCNVLKKWLPEEKKENTILSEDEVIRICENGGKVWVHSLGAYVEDGWRYHADEWSFTGYGESWVAYRNKPKSSGA